MYYNNKTRKKKKINKLFDSVCVTLTPPSFVLTTKSTDSKMNRIFGKTTQTKKEEKKLLQYMMT